MDKVTGEIKKSTANKKIPVMGTVQEITPLKAHHTRKYDINSNTIGPITTTISK